MTFSKISNLVLRVGGIGSKFLIFTLMSKYFNNDIFGDYSLITSLITILIFILGLDFYNFSIRDILTSNSEKLIRNKVFTTIIFYAIIYLLFIVIAYFVFDKITYLKPFKSLIIFLCITEHLSQEIYRLLVGFKKVLMANFLLFFRTAGWAIIIIYFLLSKIPITMLVIFKLWLLANTLTIVYVLIYILIRNYSFLNKVNIDLLWIKKGLKICYLFFIATISLKTIEYANRFIVDYYLGKELAGIFIFYSNITTLITIYVNTVVISFELPELIKNTQTRKIKRLLIQFKKSLLLHVIISAIIILLIIKPLLFWQNKTEFENYLPLLFFMLTAVSLMNYSLLYHFKLYIFHRDKSLFKIMIFSGIISLVLGFVFTKLLGIYGTAISFLISGVLIYYLRFIEAKKININD